MQQDPRYWQQLLRRSRATPPEAELEDALTPELQSDSRTTHASKKHKLKRDWTKNMGTNATVSSGQYPGKFGFDVNSSSCANDYVVFNTGLAGSGTQASITAYNNLYGGCSGLGTVPSVYWAYDTGGTISTSVTLSPDGTQLAFVQEQGSPATAALVLLKWATPGGTAGAPTQLTAIANNSYRACTAPCMTTISFSHYPITDPAPTVLNFRPLL